jgi:hypothetical protein
MDSFVSLYGLLYIQFDNVKRSAYSGSSFEMCTDAAVNTRKLVDAGRESKGQCVQYIESVASFVHAAQEYIESAIH